MIHKLTGPRRLALLNLMLRGRSKLSDTALSRKEWESFATLVEFTDKEGRRPEPGRPPRPLFVVPSEQAWALAHEMLVGPLTQKKRAAGKPPNDAAGVLEELLRRLLDYLANGNDTLATVLSSNEGAGGSPRAGRGAPGEDVLATLKKLGGRLERIRLKDVRAQLKQLSRSELDAELLELQRAGRLVIYPLDNPSELTTADRDAALEIAGAPHHIVFWES